MSFRLVVFDFDGTLADSMMSAVQIFHEIGPQLGLKPFADLHAARHMPTRQVLKAVGATQILVPSGSRPVLRCRVTSGHSRMQSTQ